LGAASPLLADLREQAGHVHDDLRVLIGKVSRFADVLVY
jgi:hypothetical protein